MLEDNCSLVAKRENNEKLSFEMRLVDGRILGLSCSQGGATRSHAWTSMDCRTCCRDSRFNRTLRKGCPVPTGLEDRMLLNNYNSSSSSGSNGVEWGRLQVAVDFIRRYDALADAWWALMSALSGFRSHLQLQTEI